MPSPDNGDADADPDDDPAPAPDAAAIAEGLRTAPFVRVVATPDGDALAAAGSLARALDGMGVPFQVRVANETDRPQLPTGRGADAPETATEDDAFVLVVGAGEEAGAADGTVATRPATAVAVAVLEALDADPDPVVTLAGLVAAGPDRTAPLGTPAGSAAIEAAGDRLTRRPGVGVPTADLGDGLAHSTLAHGPVSGDPEGARAVVADVDPPADPEEADHRRLASVVGLDVATADGAVPGAADAVGALLRPHAVDDSVPFATVEGFADVLEALAHERPGLGIALVLGVGRDGANREGVRTAALEAWRTHARAVHDAVRRAAATLARHSGVVVARLAAGADAPDESDDPVVPPARLPAVARLVRAYRSPEPVVVVLAPAPGGDGTEAADRPDRVAAIATGPAGTADADADGDPDAAAQAGDLARRAAAAADGVGYGNPHRGGARVGDADAFVAAVREAVR